jgi:hypothetical protein
MWNLDLRLNYRSENGVFGGWGSAGGGWAKGEDKRDEDDQSILYPCMKIE